MKRKYLIFILLLTTVLVGSCGNSKQHFSEEKGGLPKWAIGPFVRPDIGHPVISPLPTTFYCPMNSDTIKWEESDTFNPAATVKNGKIVILYRAEDNSGQGIGRRTSRIGYAESEDGIMMDRRTEPVLFPMNDAFKSIEWPGGCEDPRVAMTEDGLYVMLYTAWNRKTPRLAVATSRDLIYWEKHGLAFGKAYEGRFENLACKSASIVTKIKDGQLVIAKLNGKYFMYWGEHAVCAATSDDLINWEPVLNEQNELKEIAKPRQGFFDSRLTECGPPAIITKNGIVLMYNGKNGNEKDGDTDYPSGSYCAGQFLFDINDPYKILDRLEKPFFYPDAPFEKSGQYKDGTVFIEGLAYLNNKFYLYYGCADSHVAVAISDVKNLNK
jgi:predicted GH43/DUF377 family glycosyl hydrolase